MADPFAEKREEGPPKQRLPTFGTVDAIFGLLALLGGNRSGSAVQSYLEGKFAMAAKQDEERRAEYFRKLERESLKRKVGVYSGEAEPTVVSEAKDDWV